MSDTQKKKGPSFYKERIYPVLFMVIVTVIFISAVSGLFLATEDLVSLNETLFQKKAVLYSADIPLPEAGAEIEKLYQSRVEEIQTPEGLAFRIMDESGRDAGWAVFSSGPGLWGEITAVVGYNATGEEMTGVEFVKQNETPGLGARITEEWFKEQFRSKRPPFIMVPEGTSRGQSEIDSITGATRTSNAVLRLMNSSIEKAKTAMEEAK
ncbi:MAG: FMN-binding protein [Spirochaetales bacterium]|nr:FMN-binding protein [Spirochaetales bacterium]